MVWRIQLNGFIHIDRHHDLQACGNTETLDEIRGQLEHVCCATYELSAGVPICALNVPAGHWHTLRALESGTVILEMKDGAYEPLGEEDIL